MFCGSQFKQWEPSTFSKNFGLQLEPLKGGHGYGGHAMDRGCLEDSKNATTSFFGTDMTGKAVQGTLLFTTKVKKITLSFTCCF